MPDDISRFWEYLNDDDTECITREQYYRLRGENDTKSEGDPEQSEGGEEPVSDLQSSQGQGEV